MNETTLPHEVSAVGRCGTVGYGYDRQQAQSWFVYDVMTKTVYGTAKNLTQAFKLAHETQTSLKMKEQILGHRNFVVGTYEELLSRYQSNDWILELLNTDRAYDLASEKEGGSK
jgi:hypothetical protein